MPCPCSGRSRFVLPDLAPDNISPSWITSAVVPSAPREGAVTSDAKPNSEQGFTDILNDLSEEAKNAATATLKEVLCSQGKQMCQLGALVEGALTDNLSGQQILEQGGGLIGGILGGSFGGPLGAMGGSLVGEWVGGVISSTPVGDVVDSVASTAKDIGKAIASAPINVIGSLF